MKLNNKVIMFSAAALMAVSPVVSVASQATPALAAKTSTSKKTSKTTKTTKKTTTSSSSKSKTSQEIVLAKNSYVYDSTGKRNKNYKIGNKTYPVIGKGAKLKAYGTKKINGQLYYYIGKNSYIKAANVATVDGKKVSTDTAKTANKKQTTKTIKLTKNAYVYDKNGKRIKSAGTFKKGSTITYTGTTKIKGQNYYNLGKGRYVKTANAKPVKKSTGEVTPGDKDTYIKLASNSIVYNDKGEVLPPKTIFEKGAEYRALGAKKINGKWYYKVGVINGKNQWIKAANAYVTSGPALIKDSSYVEPKPSNPINDQSTIVTLKNNAPTYNSKGQEVADNQFAAGQSLRVSELRWIWVEDQNQPVEFYKIASDSSSYIKLDDTDIISGKNLTPVNTADEAHDEAVIASDTDKADLNKLLDDSTNVKNDYKYKLASDSAKKNYDNAISAGNTVKLNGQATIADVKKAVADINTALNGLNGARVTVSDLNNLSSNEADQIIKLAAQVNNVSESDIKFTNNNQDLQITLSNGYTKTLPVSDYAIQ